MQDEKTLYESLLWRGVEEAVVKESIQKKLASGEKLRIKLGIDPTGDRIHIGHAGIIRKLGFFQKLGHKIILIVGDFTAQIGDPSDKKAERAPLSKSEIKANMTSYKKQLGRIINLRKVDIEYNSSWLGKMKFDDVVRLTQMFSVAQMIERENFANRHAEGKRIGLHELLYPLMQGYDSVAVRSDIEIGGSDQLFNLLVGRTLQEQFGQKGQDVMTYSLLLGPDGRKMSKSWGNCIWVTDEPEEMFGKLMSVRDNLILDYLKLATDLPDTEVARIANELQKTGNPRDIKARMAYEVVKTFHDERDAMRAAEAFDKRFKERQIPDTVEESIVHAGDQTLPDLLVEADLAPSKSEARRLIAQGAVRVNQQKVSEENAHVQHGDIVQVGKLKLKKIIFRIGVKKKKTE